MGKLWQNWSGSVRFQPAEIAYPKSEAEVQELVRKANEEGGRIRVVGAGHSFSALFATDQILVSLDHWTGMLSVDKEKQEAVVKAGTRLKDLGEQLFAHGLAMENLGDIDVQSIAGAISTGTHGTGVNLGTIATQVISLTLVTASGELLHLDPVSSPDQFRAAQVSLGALGIVTRIGLRLEKAYKLKYSSGKSTLTQTLDNLDAFKNDHRNFEYYFFPHTETVQTKVMDKTEEPDKGGGVGAWFNDIFLENGVFWILSRISRHLGAYKFACRLSAWGVGTGTKVAWSHRVFATARLVRFQEMEYNIPAEHFEAVMREIEETIRKDDHRVHFPIECRWVKGDDIWLSPAYGRDSAYIAVHMYRGMPYKKYFAAMEDIFKRHEGRPHWGKMHTLNKKDLALRYPKWMDFLRLREELDPKGTFLNGYLSEWMGTRTETAEKQTS